MFMGYLASTRRHYEITIPMSPGQGHIAVGRLSQGFGTVALLLTGQIAAQRSGSAAGHRRHRPIIGEHSRRPRPGRATAGRSATPECRVMATASFTIPAVRWG